VHPVGSYCRDSAFCRLSVIIADSEVNLETGQFTFYKIQQKIFGMEISPEKLEMMAFLGHDSVRCKNVVHNNWLQKAVVKCCMKM
jgi:hypothetical protein